MNTQGVLDQLLRAGQQVFAGGQGGGLSGSQGALAGGALGVLLGNKKVRQYGGKALVYGGVAALGVLAYKAYGNWQARQPTAPRGEPRTLDRLPAAEAEVHSQAVLKALVAAAKADGHVDEQERALIEGEFSRLVPDADFASWLHTELQRPLDPAEVARAAQTEEMAAEMYLASVMVVDHAQFMERAYLDELARQLSLDMALKAELEAQAAR
ncbi:tellurite resistance TerB family protein [Pseudomonas typographi]|uniref:tellurite resistance TerB family protein n=1 Tax=Pseudomonas typographi TaxID=2715964 RepID=UPI0016820B68|nr:tellurite resistance TerB family protein [Pseudomonas typographi]MBD1589041.1 tellurite resistance TerB family protein [Pseudomonas typographi]